MTHALFSFRGRLPRLPYFGFGLLAFIIWVGMIAGGIVAIMAARSEPYPIPGTAFGAIIVALAIVGWLWARLALIIKRLHDMNLVGTHVIWIILLDGAPWCVAAGSYVASGLLWLVSLGVFFWLLFQPGSDGRNTYGFAPA